MRGDRQVEHRWDHGGQIIGLSLRLLPGTHTPVCDTLICMNVDRLSVTMDPELGKSVRDAAAKAGVSVSNWLGAAAADHLRNQRLGSALDIWEADFGPLTENELDDAATELIGVHQKRA